MSKTVSIAEAKDQLSKLVHDAESGSPVEITRRGRAVAVLVSHDAYSRLTADKSDFWANLDHFRARFELASDEAAKWLPERADATPRDFDW